MDLLRTMLTPEFFVTAIELTVPLLLAALAALITNKAGILNISIEGSMLISALTGAVVGFRSGNPFLGVLAAISIGALMGFFMSVLSNKLKVHFILVGIALNLLATGLVVFIVFILTGTKGDHPSLSMPNLSIPVLSKIPFLGKVVFSHNILVYVTIIVVVILYVMINQTRLGLHIKAVGENAEAAESVGINAYRTKTYALLIGGVLAGLGGAFMSMGYMSIFNTGMIAGRGFIGIAAESMGSGNVIATSVAALIFGLVNTFAIVAQVSSSIPYELLNTLPYLVTILGLVIYALKNKRAKKKKEDCHEKSLGT